MKKLISMILVMILVLTCTLAASAVQNETNGEVVEYGTITIAGATEDYDYAVYKLLHLETGDIDTGVFTYKVEEKWAGFFQTEDALAYVSIDGSGYVSQVDGADVVQFGKAALAYAEANNIAPEADSNSENFAFNPIDGVFSNLTLGYYMVDTNAGAVLCGLSTIKPDAYISTKSGTPIDRNDTDPPAYPVTYGFEIVSTDGEMPLQGAEFQLLDADKQKIDLIYNTAAGVYRCTNHLSDYLPDYDAWCNNTITVSDASGIARVEGLVNGTYYLRQIKAPDGLELLTVDREFVIAGNDLFTDCDENGIISAGSSIYVVNKKGTVLPEVGGIQWDSFASAEDEEKEKESQSRVGIIGAVLIGALGGAALTVGVVLVAKKKKSK